MTAIAIPVITGDLDLALRVTAAQSLTRDLESRPRWIKGVLDNLEKGGRGERERWDRERRKDWRMRDLYMYVHVCSVIEASQSKATTPVCTCTCSCMTRGDLPSVVVS